MGKHDNEDNNGEERVCRNCHEAGGDLIKPCACTGSIGWVHRDCLNMWRSVSPNRRSFTNCDICGQAYFMRRKAIGAGPYVAMVLRIVRDILLVLAVVLVSIVVPGGIVAGLQAGTHFMDKFTSDEGVLDVVANPVFSVFVWGAAIDCFLLGVATIVYAIARAVKASCCAGDTCCCCIPVGSGASTYYTYDTYEYHSCIPPWWWWYIFFAPPAPVDPCCYCCVCCCECLDCLDDCRCHCHDCDCGDCDCGSCDCGDCDCDKGAEILIIIVLVIIILITILGFFVGMAILGMLTIRIISNHIRVLRKQKDAQQLEVVDLSHGLAKDDPSIIVLNCDDMSPQHPPPAAPMPPATAPGAYCPPATSTDPLLTPPAAAVPGAAAPGTDVPGADAPGASAPPCPPTYSGPAPAGYPTAPVMNMDNNASAPSAPPSN